VLEDIRTYARLQLAIADEMTREQYIATVRTYAIGRHGDGEDVTRHAERTARHLWDSRR
jgi:hypothetical protein